MTDEQAKETNMTVRVEVGLRQAFAAACKDNDQSLSQTIRAMMRDYVKRNSQGDLFKKGGK